MSGLGPPPIYQYRLEMKALSNSLEVINLVLVGDTVRDTVADLVCISIDIVGINTITALLVGGLDPGSHDRLDVGDTLRSLDVEPPFIPFAHPVLLGRALSGRLVVALTGTAVTSGIELELVVPSRLVDLIKR